MINFIATKTSGFENWTGTSIDPKPVELYDINGQKLYYQFSVISVYPIEKHLVLKMTVYMWGVKTPHFLQWLIWIKLAKQ